MIDEESWGYNEITGTKHAQFILRQYPAGGYTIEEVGIYVS